MQPVDDDLEPRLAAAEAELVERLEEACALEPAEPGAENTGELLRLEDALDGARAAAERAVELRRERRVRNAGSEVAGVREFDDRAGRAWRVWSVMPSSRTGKGGSVKRVGAQYEHGWLAFESFDGDERRRLPDYPGNWQTLRDDELAELVDRAAPVAPRRRRRAEPDSHGDDRAD